VAGAFCYNRPIASSPSFKGYSEFQTLKWGNTYPMVELLFAMLLAALRYVQHHDWMSRQNARAFGMLYDEKQMHQESLQTAIRYGAEIFGFLLLISIVVTIFKNL
jgi:hypothetical protein